MPPSWGHRCSWAGAASPRWGGCPGGRRVSPCPHLCPGAPGVTSVPSWVVTAIIAKLIQPFKRRILLILLNASKKFIIGLGFVRSIFRIP